ncbi:hypothetical protein NQ318_008671, partial [Aromia moschata]
MHINEKITAGLAYIEIKAKVNSNQSLLRLDHSKQGITLLSLIDSATQIATALTKWWTPRVEFERASHPKEAYPSPIPQTSFSTIVDEPLDPQ